MGYFVQIANDVGSPVFQAVKNYPDVSFASSALFHALVTASLEHGFVPSVLRAQDATISLAVHGPADARISIAMVTSEFTAGQSRDVEAELHWRMSVVYRGALLVAGGEMLRRQPMEQLRRLLSQRLTPIVTSVMADEPPPGMGGRVPRLGLSLSGVAVEWLARSSSADFALERLLCCLPVVARAVGSSTLAEMLAVLSWQGRALAATPAWRRLCPVDRALLLSLAEQVGPSSFNQPARSWALEEADHLWLPTAGAGSVHATGVCNAPEATALRPHGVHLEPSCFSDGPACMRLQSYRMASVRIFPDPESLGTGVSEACESCVGRTAGCSSHLGSGSTGLSAPDSFGFLEPAPAEAACFSSEEASLVLSLLEVEDASRAQSRTTSDDLQASIDLCSDNLRGLWRGLDGHTPGEALLQCASGHLVAVVLINELSQDAIMLPSPVHRCTAPPWSCMGRQRKAAAARRLLYWIHALPQLTLQRPQQYACCESYAVGAIRREDGVHCWGIADVDLDPEWQGGPLGEEGFTSDSARTDDAKGRNAEDAAAPPPAPVLGALAEFMQRLPESSDLWTALGSLEA